MALHTSEPTGPHSPNARTPGTEQNVELADMGAKKASLAIEEDIMQLARLGEIRAIQKLFDSGKFDASYADEQGITPLHVTHSPVRFLELFR
jgi:palmitoyltransferase ZDHHC13/17